jgi:hypothetical protein
VASAAPALRAEAESTRPALASVPSPAEPMRALEVDTSPGGCATGECLPEVAPEPVDETPEPETHRAPAPHTVPHGLDDPSKPLHERWKAALETVKKNNPRLADSLSHARCVGVRLNELAVAFTGPQAGFHRMQCERPVAKPDLDRSFREHFGRPLTLVVEQDAPLPPEEAQVRSPAQELAQKRAAREERLKQSAREHPAVKAALGLFGGTLQEIRVRDEIPRPEESSDGSEDA